MITLKAHFDGRVLVPEEAVDLPLHRTLEIRVEDTGSEATLAESPLAALVEISRTFSDDSGAPSDLAAQHDHYLHGASKRP